MPESFKPIRPVLAPAAGGEVFSLDTYFERFEALVPGDVVGILGGARSGRSTTLKLLEPRLPRLTVVEDGPSPSLASRVSSTRPLVYAAIAPLPFRHTMLLRLKPWCQDQWIEYLLANHRDGCDSVMRRILGARHIDRLRGNPELWATAMDLMAGDESVHDPVEAIRAFMGRRSRARSAFRKRHQLCDAVFGAKRIVDRLVAGRSDALPGHADEELLTELAFAVARPAVSALLVQFLLEPSRRSHAVAVSVLHRAGIGWRPYVGASLRLDGARLSAIDWAGVTLERLIARRADLSNASLSSAQLGTIDCTNARLDAADFRFVTARASCFLEAHLAGADLGDAVLHNADFKNADLSNVHAEGADITACDLTEADCSGARFVRADLSRARLVKTQLHHADFSAANLAGARLIELDLRSATLHGARMAGATVHSCRFDGVCAEALDFHNATINSCDFSLSTFRNSLFENAQLSNCGLADIDWESANLRNADFRGSTFHAGSSRSGLVYSPIACEGSKTGFYTDDFADRTHMAPEDIRKANLCRADLRGSKIDNVDFYLVDLRQAKYDPAQADWFKRCGAILYDKR